MKAKARWMAALLCLALLPALLGGCGKKTPDVPPQDNTTDGGTQESTRNAFTEVCGEYDFGGREFRMAGVDWNLWEQYYDMRIDVAADSGDELSQAIWSRNRAMESTLNIKLVYQPNEQWLFELSNYLQKCVMNGLNNFDTFLMIDRDAITSAINGDIIAYDNLPTLDLSHSWWSEVNRDISISGKYFFAYGNDSLHFLESVNALAFNKAMAESVGEDLYAKVTEKEWSIEEMFRVAALLASENGDGIFNDLDTYGFITEADMFFPSLWQCAGFRTVEKDEADTPLFAIPGNENFYTLMNRLYDKSYNDDLTLFQTLYSNATNYNANAFGNYIAAGNVMFADGHGLFRTVILKDVPSIRSMDVSFGLLPYPLRDSTQESYISRVYSGFPTVVPVFNTELALTGTVLEALACFADEIYMPVYYDRLLRGKMPDPESAQMLDILFATRTMDLGDTLWYDYIRVRYQDAIAKDKVRDLASMTDIIRGGAEKIIRRCVENLTGTGGST